VLKSAPSNQSWHPPIDRGSNCQIFFEWVCDPGIYSYVKILFRTQKKIKVDPFVSYAIVVELDGGMTKPEAGIPVTPAVNVILK